MPSSSDSASVRDGNRRRDERPTSNVQRRTSKAEDWRPQEVSSDSMRDGQNAEDGFLSIVGPDGPTGHRLACRFLTHATRFAGPSLLARQPSGLASVPTSALDVER